MEPGVPGKSGEPADQVEPSAVKEPSETSDGTADVPEPSPSPTPAPASALQDETIELGDVQLGAVDAESAVRDARGSDGPVFVDESGRRSRRFRRLGVAVAVACAGYAAVIVATLLSGNSAAPWLPVPGQHEDKPAGKVHTSPLPSVSTTPTTNPTPPGAGAVTAPVVGAEAGGPAVPGSGAPAGADASASTEPDGATDSAPAADAGTTGSPTPSAPATDVSPAPSATGTATAPAPTPTPSGRTHTPPGHTRRPHPKLSL
ncbi:hypothetical protein SHJG_4433 [Streptomyces hygroscopicus subsp. jinggangensis 5008]|nr:hypothetical protein SHJG_4433 [Streptomyces hygroscopicus subsp. jinggangensis 5008]AGF63861.1 hypothetical protein SHJGH_4196 [Streptomyces hygroscopicus subsp. jinggangensis TL01]